MNSENRLLKNQIVKLSKLSAPYFNSAARTTTVALASIISVMVLVGSIPSLGGVIPSTPGQNPLDLKDYIDSAGISAQQKLDELLKDLNVNIHSYLPNDMTETGSEFENDDESSSKSSRSTRSRHFAEFDESNWSPIPTQDLSFVRFDRENIKPGALSLSIPGT